MPRHAQGQIQVASYDVWGTNDEQKEASGFQTTAKPEQNSPGAGSDWATAKLLH
ncbi:MAG: hypothetical protein ABSE48_12940 [Verrucomicrobiota bacterium]